MKRLSILLFVLAFPAWGEPLTFDAAWVRAAQNNASLQNAKAQLRAAEYRQRAAGSGFLPDVSGSVSYSDSAGRDGSYSAGVTARQNVFSGFADTARVEQSDAQLASAQAALATANARLSHDLKAAYVGLWYAQHNVELSESILRRLEENLRLVELRFESGRENKGSYLLTRASTAQARLERLQARQALITAQTQLARVLGETGEWNAIGDVPIAEPEASPDFALLVRTTPEFRDVVARQAAAEASVRLARAGYYPSLSVSGSVSRDGDHWFPKDNDSGVSATISIPIYSGGSTYYGVQESLAQLDAAKANLSNVERDLLVRLRQSYASFVEAVERLKVDREFLDAAETRASIARARYQNGLISFEDWDRIEGDLIQRQKSWLATQRDRVTAQAAWELVQGKGATP